MQITDDIIERFRGMFPGLAYDSCTIETALIEGDQETGGSRWGAYSVDDVTIKMRGMFYYAAHWLLINQPNPGRPSISDGQTANQVASKSIGDESISYAANQDGVHGADAWLMTTSYGQQFYRLRKRVGMGALIV